jgi:hypothetical protein
MNSKNHFFVRGNLQKDTTAGDENFPGQPAATFYDDNTKGMSFGHTWIPTSHIVNDARYGYVRQGWQNGGIAPGTWVDIFGLTQPTAQTGTTLLHVPVNNITDTLTWNKGTHTFAFGGNWRSITNHHSSNTGSFDGASTNYQYANTGDLPVPANMASRLYQPVESTPGQISWASSLSSRTFTTTPSQAPPRVRRLPPVHRSPRISTPMSGRATCRTPGTPAPTQRHFRCALHLLQTPYETNGQQIAPTIDTDAWYKKRESAAQQGQIYEPLISLAPAGKANHAPGYWPEQKNNFAPRIGVVWSPDAKTSIRASAGMYYDHYGEALVNTFDTTGSYGLAAGISNSADVLGFENAPRFTGPHNLPDIPLPPSHPRRPSPSPRR